MDGNTDETNIENTEKTTDETKSANSEETGLETNGKEETGDEKPVDPPDPPDPITVRLTQVSPIAASIVGGIPITLTGTGFQPGIEVYFGSNAASDVVYETSTRITATLPAASQTGVVNIIVINPDGSSATKTNAFTYVTSTTTQHAEVFGVTPLSVIEDTLTQITIRGLNLIIAYNQGVLALRGPERATIEISNVTTSGSPYGETVEPPIDEVIFTLRITANPPLDAIEKMAIQVLASTRPGAQNDGVYESSSKMFTLLPKAVPVPLAYTAEISLDQPSPIVIVGRNLKNCTIDLGQDAVIHTLQSDDETISGVVTIRQNGKTSDSLQKDGEQAGIVQLTILDPKGNATAQFGLSEISVEDFAEYDDEEKIDLHLTPIPDQPILGPTENDSVISSVNQQTSLSINYSWPNFAFTAYQITIILPIINSVRLIPLFDGGGDFRSPVLARVGKLFRLRGLGILVAIKVQFTIRIRVIIIVGFNYNIWPYGLFNEFPQYGYGLGSIVIDIIVEIRITFSLGFLIALAEPTGNLRVLFAINLVLGIDFSLDSDGKLKFGPIHKYRPYVIGISPLSNLMPCDGRFQLASDNGQTTFVDSFGGYQSFYFPRVAGECCLSWDYNVQLVRFQEGGPEEVVQDRFQTEFCLTALSEQNQHRVYIWSEPEPTGVPQTLEMELGDLAQLVVLAEPVDSSGNPTGSPVDIRDLDYNVEFFFDGLPYVLNPDALRDGDAQAIRVGNNIIKAAVTSFQILEDSLSFYPGSIDGFEILRFLAQGRSPGVKPKGLPVAVDPIVIAADYQVTPILTYRNQAGELIKVTEIERLEPHETPREYVLAARVVAANRTSDVTIEFPSLMFKMVSGSSNRPLLQPDDQFPDNRGDIFDHKKFFSGNLVNQTKLTLHVPQNADLMKPIAFENSDLFPNLFEEGTTTGSTNTVTKAVPPGAKVTGNETKLNIKVSNMPTITSGSGSVSVTDIEFDFPVKNDETYEEYYRVFFQIRSILHPSRSPVGRKRLFHTFASRFQVNLTTDGLTELIDKGKELWQLGYEFVQNEQKDDRYLYYTRLEAIAVLRAYYRRNPSSTTTFEKELNKFEWSSRGLETSNGERAIIKFSSTNERKIIFTGFDPFFLHLDPLQGNTSGIAALGINNQSFPDAVVKTAVIPVRWRDFDLNQGLIEFIMEEGVKTSSMIITCSLTGQFFNIDRFATRYRTTSTIDNEHKKSTTNHPLGTSVPHYIETTLPYECPDVLAPNKRLDGNAFLVLDQSFEQSSGGGFAANPILGDINSYKKSSNVPTTGIEVIRGSGGNYLSNEIFYRTANVRRINQPGLPTGHLHIRPLTVNSLPPITQTLSGDDIVKGVKNVINLFLATLKRVVFPDTKITLNSLSSVTVTNAGSTQSVITSISFISGSPVFELVTSLPITIAPGNSTTLQFKFTPNDIKRFVETVQLKNSAGDVLYCFQLEGSGIDPLVSIPTSISFPDTVINTENSKTVTIKNVSASQTITLSSIVVNSPFSLQTALPITLNPGNEKILNFKFMPSAVGNFTDTVALKDGSGITILEIPINGKGVTTPPAPVITSFTPTSGYPFTAITVTGANFIDVQQAFVGNNQVFFDSPINSTEIVIYAENSGGKIKIITSYGEVQSSATFFVIPIRNPPDEY